MTVIRTTLAALIVAVLAIALPGCAQAAPKPTRLVAYGHSYVAGYGVTPDQSYPFEAATALGLRDVNRAVSGAVVRETLLVARTAPRPTQRDVVVVEIGLNDAREYGWHGLAQYRANLRALLERVSTAGRVIVVLDPTIPGWQMYAPYDHGSPQVMRAYRTAARRIGHRHGATVVRPALTAAMFQTDLIHPNADGYQRIAEKVAQAAS